MPSRLSSSVGTKLLVGVTGFALVVYLIVSKRLFGVRGGARAAHAKRQEESLLEVEASAAEAQHA